MSDQENIIFKFGDKAVEENQPSRSQASFPTVSELTSLGHLRTFGAIIVTRPFNDVTRSEYFRAYTLNPSIVKTWLDTNPCNGQLSRCLTGCRTSQEDIRIIYNVNEFRVRISPDRQHPITRGLNELWWTENESGNEFQVVTDLWPKSP